VPHLACIAPRRSSGWGRERGSCPPVSLTGAPDHPAEGAGMGVCHRTPVAWCRRQEPMNRVVQPSEVRRRAQAGTTSPRVGRAIGIERRRPDQTSPAFRRAGATGSRDPRIRSLTLRGSSRRRGGRRSCEQGNDRHVGRRVPRPRPRAECEHQLAQSREKKNTARLRALEPRQSQAGGGRRLPEDRGGPPRRASTASNGRRPSESASRRCR